MVEDRGYLKRRVAEERMLAERAADPTAFRAHSEMAREYERQLELLSEDPEQPLTSNHNKA